MIQTLADAWEWYQGVTKLRHYMGRLGTKYWDEEPLSGLLATDNDLREVEAPHIQDMVRRIEADLEDLGVLLIFSVFEAIVRERVGNDVEQSLPEKLHPAVAEAIEDLRDNLEQGSFFRITRLFKRIDHNLVEEVNQVRRYRNWVAHGRRGDQPESVDPRTAYQRLTRFMEELIKFQASARGYHAASAAVEERSFGGLSPSSP
jgi:hypothetical protein